MSKQSPYRLRLSALKVATLVDTDLQAVGAAQAEVVNNVRSVVTGMYITRSSSGLTAGGVVPTATRGGAAVTLLNDVPSGNTLSLSVLASGKVVVRRTAGQDAFDVSFQLIYI